MTQSGGRYWQQIKEHTRVKHRILENYLMKWQAILGQPSPTGKIRILHYVDTHAGRGHYEGDEPGSPIIAMLKGEELHRHLKSSFHLDCHNVEIDHDNFLSLQREVRQKQPSCPSVTTKNYHGSFLEHMPTILKAIPPGEPAFIFVDPFGYTEVELDTLIEWLKERRYHELFITFMSQFVSRFLSDETKHERFNSVLGTTKWREFIGVRDAEEKIVNLYAQELQQTGCVRLGTEVLAYPIKVHVGSPYYLVHVSQSPKGRLEMETAVRRAKSGFQQLSPLFTSGDIEKAVMEIIETRPGIRALEVASSIWAENPNATWWNDIRVAIQSLSNQEAVKIIGGDGKERGKGVFPQEKNRLSPTGKTPNFSNTLF